MDVPCVVTLPSIAVTLVSKEDNAAASAFLLIAPSVTPTLFDKLVIAEVLDVTFPLMVDTLVSNVVNADALALVFTAWLVKTKSD